MKEIGLEEALKDPRAGPRPISLDEYRRRNPAPHQIIETPGQPQKKEKTGVEARFRREIKEAIRSWVLAPTQEARIAASRKIDQLKQDRRNYRNQKLKQKKMLAKKGAQK